MDDNQLIRGGFVAISESDAGARGSRGNDADRRALSATCRWARSSDPRPPARLETTNTGSARLTATGSQSRRRPWRRPKCSMDLEARRLWRNSSPASPSSSSTTSCSRPNVRPVARASHSLVQPVASEGCHDPETVRWVRVRRHPLRLQCRSSYYVQLSLSGLPTGKWQRLRSNGRRSEGCGADAWGAAVSQNRWRRRQSDRTRFLPDLWQPRDRQIGTAAQHPRIAGGKLGRPINVPTHDGRIYLKRAALGSHGPQGPKAHARHAAVITTLSQHR